MKTIKKFQCEGCDAVYDTEAQARKCEARGVKPPRVAVGDIVLARAGFGWFDGDKKWIENYDALGGDSRNRMGRRLPCPNKDSNCFGECCTFRFYYVVTHIDHGSNTHDAHEVRYHIETMAMSGSQGYRGGYTFDEGHTRIEKVARPPAHVVETAKALIGNKQTRLL